MKENIPMYINPDNMLISNIDDLSLCNESVSSSKPRKKKSLRQEKSFSWTPEEVFPSINLLDISLG